MADEQSSDNRVIQIAKVMNLKEEEEEEQTTNVLVIITQNGATPIDLNSANQQIVVVNQDDQTMPTKGKVLTLQTTDTHEGNPMIVENEEMPLYQDVSVQTTETRKYSHITNVSGNKKYECLICGKELANGSILKRHIRIHTGVRPYQCSLCNKRFTQSNDLTAHMRSHTGSRPFKCEVCGKGFTQRQNVKKHMLTHTGEKNFECEVCGKRFSRKHHMEEHSRIHSHSDIRCHICEKGFTANGHLKRHLNKYHPETVLERDIQTIIQHEQSNAENEMPVVNFTTGQESVETETVEIGNIEHPEQDTVTQVIVGQLEPDHSLGEQIPEVLYRCDLCEKQFKDLSLLERHLRLHLEGKLFSCNICNKVFNYKGLLKRHMVVHTKDKQYECEECHKKFTQSNDLKIHQRLHTGTRPYKCDVCKLSFNQKQQLKNHRRKHTGERPFACEKCEKRFSRRDHLKSHISTHKNDHLRCQICGFTCRNMASLEKHLNKHNNASNMYHSFPFLSCRFCPKKYKDITRLRKHEDSHEKSNLYKCNVCGLTYFQFETFEKHCKIHEEDARAVKSEECLEEKDDEYVGTMIKIEMEDESENEEVELSEEKKKIPVSSASASSSEVTDMNDKIDENSEGDAGTSDQIQNMPNEEAEVEGEGHATIESETGGNQKNTMYCCSHCGKMLPWNADLVKHMESHLPDQPGERPSDVTKTGIVRTTNDGRYMCSICGRHFTNLIALQSHIKNIHAMDISDYELNYKESDGCMMTQDQIKMIEKQIQENLRFTGCYSVLKNAAKKHRKGTSEDKDRPIFQCEICAKVLKRKEVLERHRKLHEVTHKCEICNKVFKQKNHLETHRLIKHDDTGGKRITPTLHTCDHPGCGKYFNKRFNLIRHQLLHQKEVIQKDGKEADEAVMVYECRKCNEAFATFQALEDHVIVNHSDDQDDSEKKESLEEGEVEVVCEDDTNEDQGHVEMFIENADVLDTSGDVSESNDIVNLTSNTEIPSVTEDVDQSIQEVVEMSGENIPVAMHHEENQIIIEIPQGESSDEQKLFRYQIITSGNNTTSDETVPIILSQDMTSSVATAPTETDSNVTIESMTDSTESDNSAAIAMVALSGDITQYIEDEHAYVHSA